MQNNQTVVAVSLGDLDLPFKASWIMDYHDAAVEKFGDRIVVGYLADDSDCQNPLEDDGVGKLYSAHRHSRTHSEMQEALALDSDWGPNLDLVDKHPTYFRKEWIEKAADSADFQVWADETAGASASLTPAYYKRRATKLWDETDGEYNYRDTCVHDFLCYEDAKQQAWETLRTEGLIGDRDAVSLDCYEHGGIAWSVAGSGMQCQWDTSRGAGVWVPDNDSREEIDRRAKVYAYGQVVRNGTWTRRSGKLRYQAVLDNQYGGASSEEFVEWHEAFEWLQAATEKRKLSRRKADRLAQERRGRERAACEIAKGDLETYNDWLAGNCYGIVAATYVNVAKAGEEPEWQFVDSDECWGFIGDDYAMDEATANAKCIAEFQQKQAA